MEALEQQINDVLVIRPLVGMERSAEESFYYYVMSRIEGGARKILFDLSELHYISSDGLRMFNAFLTQLKETGGEMAICSSSPFIRELIEYVYFKDVLKIHEHYSQVLQYLTGNRSEGAVKKWKIVNCTSFKPRKMACAVYN